MVVYGSPEAGYLLAQQGYNPNDLLGGIDFPGLTLDSARARLRSMNVPETTVDLLLNSPYKDAVINYAITGDLQGFQDAITLTGLADSLSGGGGGGASTEQRAAAAAAEFRNLAGQFGVTDKADWDALGYEAAVNNWSVAMIKDAVANLVSADSLRSASYIRDIYDKAKSAGAQYFVRLGTEEVLDFARKIASDDMSEESILSIIKDRAKAQFSWLSDVIDSGKTLQEYFRPHREEIARLLEVSPEAINLMDDPKWQKVVQRPADDMDQSLRSMSIYETQKYVRSMNEWKATNNARTDAANMVGALAQVMGGL